MKILYHANDNTLHETKEECLQREKDTILALKEFQSECIGEIAERLDQLIGRGNKDYLDTEEKFRKMYQLLKIEFNEPFAKDMIMSEEEIT